MKTRALLVSMAAAAAIGAAAPSYAHGGTYRGPGDTPPPGGANPGGGGHAPPPPGPTGPGGTPGTPTGTPAPLTPGQTPGGNTPTGATSARGGELGIDMSVWDFWWGFNREPYLNLRRKVRSMGVMSGSDEEILGYGQEFRRADSLRPGEALIRGTVVPALKHALATEEQNDIVTGCLIALAKIGDVKGEDGSSEFVEIISGFLSASEQEISETAALALGILADDRSVPSLVGLMRDDKAGRSLMKNGGQVPFRTQTFAAYGLGLVGYRTSSEPLRRVIAGELVDFADRDDFSRPDQQVGALQALGLVPLAWTIEGEGPTSSRAALIDHLLTKLEPVASRGGYSDHRVRAQVPIAIARLLSIHGDSFAADLDSARAARERAVNALLEVVGKRSRETRVEVVQSAVIALGMIGDAADGEGAGEGRAIFTELERISRTAADNQTEFFALMSMAQMGGRPGIGDDPRGLQSEVRKALLRALARGKGQKRPWAGLALGVFGHAVHQSDGVLDPAVTLAVRGMVKSAQSEAEAGAYAISLGLLGDSASVAPLMERLEELGSGQEDVRGNICVALGLLEAGEAQEILHDTVVRSKFRPVALKQAAIGLGLLGDKSAVGTLLDMLESARSLASQAAVASAIGTIGDVTAVDGLVKMLSGETEKKMTGVARGFAAVALGITCDKEDFPWNTKLSVNANYRANVLSFTDPGAGTGILDIL